MHAMQITSSRRISTAVGVHFDEMSETTLVHFGSSGCIVNQTRVYSTFLDHNVKVKLLVFLSENIGFLVSQRH